jgi:hypothetical protein
VKGENWIYKKKMWMLWKRNRMYDNQKVLL